MRCFSVSGNSRLARRSRGWSPCLTSGPLHADGGLIRHHFPRDGAPAIGSAGAIGVEVITTFSVARVARSLQIPFFELDGLSWVTKKTKRQRSQDDDSVVLRSFELALARTRGEQVCAGHGAVWPRLAAAVVSHGPSVARALGSAAAHPHPLSS